MQTCSSPELKYFGNCFIVNLKTKDGPQNFLKSLSSATQAIFSLLFYYSLRVVRITLMIVAKKKTTRKQQMYEKDHGGTSFSKLFSDHAPSG